MQMNDLISRTALLNDLTYSAPELMFDKEYVFYKIQKQRTVDAVPVVRCKDCRYYNTNYCGDGFGWCERNGIGHGTSDDWFCADGEK